MSKNQSPEMDTGDKITFAVVFGFPLLLLIIFMTGLLVTREAIPNHCYINHQTTDTPIETRNYKPSRSWSTHEWGWCFNPTKATYEGCWKDEDHYEPATFEWRYVGTEDWAKETREPAGTDNEHPYRRVTEYDVQICDGRSQHADKNGQIESHQVSVSYYI